MLQRILVFISVLLLSATATAQNNPEYFYAYGDDASLYRLTATGETLELQNNIRVPQPITGARVDDMLILGNVPDISEMNTILGILRPETYEPIGLNLERQAVFALDAPVIQPPYVLFGAEYNLQDLGAKYVALINVATGESWQLLDELQDCGLRCVRMASDNSRVTYPVVSRGLGSTPRTTLRLTDFTTADTTRQTRYEINVTGNYLFEFEASNSGDWWLITETNLDNNDRRLLFVDPNGDEQALPDATETTRWEFIGEALIGYDVTCDSDCLLSYYPDVTGDALQYRLPSGSPFGSDWHLLADNTLLMVFNRDGYILSTDADAMPVLDGNYTVDRLHQSTNTLQLSQTVDDTVSYAVLDLDTLTTLGEVESQTRLNPFVERNGDFLLMRDRNSDFAAFIDSTQQTQTVIPDNLLCKELTRDGNVLCEQDGNIIRYNPTTGDTTLIAENMVLVDGF